MFAKFVAVVRRRFADESGSMLVALMAAIVASFLMLAVSSYAFAGHRQMRFDRDRGRVIQAADAGVNEAINRFNLPPGDPERIAAAYPPPEAGNPTPFKQETLGDSSTFRWRVDPWPAGQTADWKVESYGTVNGVTRHVRAILGRAKPFKTAAFADSHMVLRGDNRVDSYPATGSGTIGSNGDITLNGSVVVDGVEVHNWEGDSTAARCVQNGNYLCDEPKRQNVPPPRDLTSDTALGFITEAMADLPCPAAPGPWPGNTLGPGVYCFSSMNFTANVNFTGTATNPTIVYLTGPTTAAPVVSVANGVRVNCPTVTNGLCSPRPEASRLQIFTKAVNDVRIGANTHFAGVVYAPRSSCRGNPSNAQANVYGSMVCGIITNQGGWRFHYDEALGQMGFGGVNLLRWAEE